MKRKKFTLFLSVLFFSISILYGQFPGPGSNWYFGTYAGVTWNVLQANGDPMYLMDGAVNTGEGVATISDNAGNLLFYTDGITVWDASHQKMANSLNTSPGGTLTGNSSSTQSGVIVPKPMDPNTYYIFSVDANYGFGGLAFSRVDMLANGGLGDIDLMEKNIPLFTPSTEKITAVNHANNTDIWVITHQWQNNQFNAYLVNSTGVQFTTPVISNIGVVHTGASGNTRGYMKASPSGDMVCLGIEGMNIWELFDFDNTTGQLSNPLILDYTSNNDCYGVEFSADGKYLYGSERWGYEIHQWDLSVPVPAAILASHTIVATTSTAYGGALQLANDQKIYLARSGTKYIGRINEPSLPGSLCDYDDQAVLLGPDLSTAKGCREGLPTFIATFFNVAEFTFKTSCDHDTVFFFIPNPQGLEMAYWNFNWPSTDPAYHYQGTVDSVYFIYNAGGIYTVELITERDNDLDTAYADVYFSQTPKVYLGPDATLCDNDELSYDLSYNDQYALTGACEYFWEAQLASQTFYDSNATYLINKPGTYSVTVYSDSICGSKSDFINVEYNNMDASLGVDITSGLCQGDIQVLDATYSNTTYGNSQYTWSTGSIQPTINVVSTGIYSVTVENGDCTDVDSIYVQFDSPLVMPLGPDRNLCADSLITLHAANVGANYAWSTGSFSQTIEVDIPGIYAVTITNDCGQIMDTILLSPLGIPPVNLGPDITMCEGTPTTLDATVPNSTYLWSTGQQLNQIAIFGGGTYSVTATNECGDNFDDIYVYGDTPLTELDLGNDTSVCSGFLLDCGQPGMEYHWSNNATTQSIVITQSDDYGVDITNMCGTYSDMIHIDIIELDIDLGPDTFLCNPEETIILDAENPGSVYDWSNGAITPTIEISTPGLYSLTVTNVCESQWDEINVFLFDNTLDLGPDTTFCEGESLMLDAAHPGSNYLWNTGATTQSIVVDQSGLYTLDLTHYCGDFGDEINITVKPAPVVNFGADTVYIVGGVPIVLNPGSGSGDYLWSTGEVTESITAFMKGTYSVTVTNSFGCVDVGSVVVENPVGIDDAEVGEQIALYPNPASENLYVSAGKFRIERISVYNALGSMLIEQNDTTDPICVNLDQLPTGMYFIKITTTNQEEVVKPFSVIK